MIHWGAWVDYALPGWVASTAYAVGEMVAPGNGHRYIVTAITGSSGTVQPTWPTGAGATVVDGGVTWQEHGAVLTYNGSTSWHGTEAYAGSALDHFAQNVATKPSVARFGEQWLSNGVWIPFSSIQGAIDAAWAQGMITLLDWDNWDLTVPANNKALNYAAIIAGSNAFGGTTIIQFLTAWAQAAGAYKHPFIIRMWHEQNALNGWSDNNFPWAIGNVTAGGNAWTNTAAQHISAWQIVVSIFRQYAPNVAFMWCPNIMGTTGPTSSIALNTIYPGSAYVDWLALDGYNQYDSTTTTFQQLFRGGAGGLQDSWNALYSLDTTKPIAIAETNADPNHNFSARGTWYQGALETYQPDATILPNLAMVCWFMWSYLGGPDLAPDQDGSATGDLDFAPFKHGIASTFFLAGGTFDMPSDGSSIVAFDVRKQSHPFDTAVKSTSTPMAWWKLNEAAGSGSVADASGRGHTGTPQAGVSLGQSGVMPAPGAPSAPSFNGSASNGYITVPNSADHSLAGLGDAGLITSFVVPSDAVAADVLGVGQSNQYEYELQITPSGGAQFTLWDLVGSPWLVVTAGNASGPVGIALGVPQFAAIQYVSTASPRAHAWLNPSAPNTGVASSDSSPTPAAAAGTSPLAIGQRPDGVRPLTAGARVGPTVIFSPGPNKWSVYWLYVAWAAAQLFGRSLQLGGSPSLPEATYAI